MRTESPNNTTIARMRISAASRMRQVVAVIGNPAAGHSGHMMPIAEPSPTGMMSRISRRTSPTIRSFRATALTVAPGGWMEHPR